MHPAGLYNPNGIYSKFFKYQISEEHQSRQMLRTIQLASESPNGYLDYRQVHEHYYNKPSDSNSNFSLVIYSEDAIFQCRLVWNINFDLVDNLVIYMFNMLEPILKDKRYINLVNLKYFFEANEINVININEIPIKEELELYELNELIDYSGTFVYHLMSNVGVGHERLPRDIQDIKMIDKDFEDYRPHTELLQYMRFQKEDIFLPLEPTTFQFERKRFK